MKLISQTFDKDRSGSVSLIPHDREDLWALYNLIAKDDEITLKTYRNVKKNAGSSTSNKSGGATIRKLITLKLNVENVDFTPSDDVMRIKGRTLEQNEDVPLGSYHTAELEYNQKFTLFKNDWDEIAFDIVTKSCSIEERAEVGAVVLQEGVAHICLLTDNMTVLRSKIEKSIPRKKRGDSTNHDKSLQKFLETTAETMIRNLNIEKLKAIILVGPGFIAKDLLDTIIKIATKNGDKALIQSKSKFLVAHSSTGYLQGLEESLRLPEIRKQLNDTKFQLNIAAFDEFSKLLNEDSGKAFYGEKECEKAIELTGAVKVLMITDTLFKSDDIAKRKKFIKLADKVKEDGGDVVIFSSLHDSGEQLNQLTGVAVILNYPVPDLEDMDEEDEEVEDFVPGDL
ncbi:hypothetical protein B5S28_g2652 [[Candida] boidinii]|nr:hypothetical protein B5S28_g2652 [[Candida] boidinii]OWB60270.1 hypothetical protein B5S29_g1141 [[Candida] boidinii]OWB71225.1 hypothetical protein B5S31_g910 [[Candida] boidinii]